MDKSRVLIQLITAVLVVSMTNDFTILQKIANRNKAAIIFQFEEEEAAFEYDFDGVITSNKPQLLLEREHSGHDDIVAFFKKEKKDSRNRADIIYAIKEKRLEMGYDNTSTELASFFDSLCGTIIYAKKQTEYL